MRFAHSRVVFAALDNLIDNHYIQCMRKNTMTYMEAVYHLTKNGDTLLEALELFEYELDNGSEFLSDKTIEAYNLVNQTNAKISEALARNIG